MSELRGAQRLGLLSEKGRAAAQALYPADAALERLATWLNENANFTFETASAEEVVDAAIRQLEFAVEANRKFCETNERLDRVVSAVVRELRTQGFVA